MTKERMLALLGLATLAFLAFGAVSFGKMLTERKVPTIEERLELLKVHGSLQSRYERTELIKSFAALRRPLLPISFVSAGDCESFLDSADFYLNQAGAVLGSAAREGRLLLEFTTNVAVQMAYAYDDCLGNP